MSGRARQPDTEADRQLYECLNAIPPRSFSMVAGAGSGKTTSLIKGLSEILSTNGRRLRLRRQKVACITYTEVAAGEIWADVGNNPLVHVATIHSFLWSVARSFQADIRDWVAARVDERIANLRTTAANFGPRVQQRTRDKNRDDVTRYERLRERIPAVRDFTYGTGSNYADGILGHDDILKMVPQFIADRPLMRRLLVQQYPFLFVDESQDTAENVVTALKEVDKELGHLFCLGCFGDPMQRIFPTGIGEIEPLPDWALITKPENFRCPPPVLDVANAIRRDADGLVQTGGRMAGPPEARVGAPGSARIFILPVDARRDELLGRASTLMARSTDDPCWLPGGLGNAVKVLVIVHRMAANHLGFGALYAAMNDKAPEDFRNGFLDGTAWPVRPFTRFVLPLVEAMSAGDEFGAMQVLRNRSPLLAQDGLAGVAVARRLAEIRAVTGSLCEMLESGAAASNGDVLRLLRRSGLYALDPRLVSYLDFAAADPVLVGHTGGDDDDLSKEVAAMDAFLSCPAAQFRGYYRYMNEQSPFSTHQGVKGAEFERVLVVLDDDEGTHVQFSYDKLLGTKPLSERDMANRREGKETVVERTRRLLYVCCTRASKDLAVVFFTGDVPTALRQIAALGLFPAAAVHVEEDLAAG